MEITGEVLFRNRMGSRTLLKMQVGDTIYMVEFTKAVLPNYDDIRQVSIGDILTVKGTEVQSRMAGDFIQAETFTRQ